jgi:hypothetical protein
VVVFGSPRIAGLIRSDCPSTLCQLEKKGLKSTMFPILTYGTYQDDSYAHHPENTRVYGTQIPG